MLTAEDAERSGALTDTNAFNAVCDQLAHAEQALADLQEACANIRTLGLAACSAWATERFHAAADDHARRTAAACK